MGMPVEPTFDQDGFRGRTNVPDPSGLNAAFDGSDAAKDADFSYDVDTILRLRLVIKQTNAATTNAIDSTTEFIFQYNNTGAGWINIGAVGGGSEDVDFVASTGFADHDNTTQLFGSATFETGDGLETNAISDSVVFTELTTSETEMELALIINSGQVANDDTIQIRALYSAGDASPPATPMSGTTVPTITVVEGAPSTLYPPHLFDSSVSYSGDRLILPHNNSIIGF